MASSDEAVALLRSIDASLKLLVKQQGAGNVADDRDLDGKFGDPLIKAVDPRDWTGDSMKGRHFSECPAEYLDLLASRFDYFAEQAEQKDERTTKGKPVAPYNRQDAKRARGWAQRIRDGKVPASTKAAGNGDEWGEAKW